MAPMRLIDPRGRRRRVHLRCEPGRWTAWVRTGLLSRRAASATMPMMAMSRLADYMGLMGWRVER